MDDDGFSDDLDKIRESSLSKGYRIFHLQRHLCRVDEEIERNYIMRPNIILNAICDQHDAPITLADCEDVLSELKCCSEK